MTTTTKVLSDSLGFYERWDYPGNATTNVRLTQLAFEAITDVSAVPARLTQFAFEAITDVAAVPARLTQFAVEVITSNDNDTGPTTWVDNVYSIVLGEFLPADD